MCPQNQQLSSPFITHSDFFPIHQADALGCSSEESSPPGDTDAGLEDAARSEREYVRQRLREELKREPAEEEVSEWLRQHTEGY